MSKVYNVIGGKIVFIFGIKVCEYIRNEIWQVAELEFLKFD